MITASTWIFNAIQSLCILRNTQLIFGDVVERDNNRWNLVLLLLKIVNTIFSPIITDGMVCYLKHLIFDHHNMFKTLFPDKKKNDSQTPPNDPLLKMH